jgi:hypothetical protein
MAETLGYIQMLQAAVEKTAGCKAKHNRTEHIEENFQNAVVWVGDVEEFLLIDHPQARHAYAWGHAMKDTGEDVRVFAILGVPPVDSPLNAVRVSLVADARANKSSQTTVEAQLDELADRVVRCLASWDGGGETELANALGLSLSLIKNSLLNLKAAGFAFCSSVAPVYGAIWHPTDAGVQYAAKKNLLTSMPTQRPQSGPFGQ